MVQIDFNAIVKEAVKEYDSSRQVVNITDISAKVSTNHVYRIRFADKSIIIAKLSYFGKFEHFVEDHSIINALSTNLPTPFQSVLARSLVKGDSLFVHHHRDEVVDAWVIFYQPMKIQQRLPKRLNESQIQKLARSFAKFHKACTSVKNTLPSSSKTIEVDTRHLLRIIRTGEGKLEHHMHLDPIKKQCDTLLENMEKLGADDFPNIPVFVDWNIGNFSVTSDFQIYSRWDYDWFRMSSRMMDFYFFSRVVSSVGDKTVFSYNINPLMEERFVLFLKTYHEIFPLTEPEIRFLQEAYRFFLLNYVVKYGRYFFHEIFATRLQHEAFENHFPMIEEQFNAEKLLTALDL